MQGLRHRSEVWWALSALLATVVALFAPLIAATALPDQSWLGGLYDADDDDTILVLVSEQCPGIPPIVVVPVPAGTVASIVPPAALPSTGRRLAAPPSRAPPRA